MLVPMQLDGQEVLRHTLLVCSLCGDGPDFAGPLCLDECPYEKGTPRLRCKRCVLESVIFQAEVQSLQEDAELWSAHVAECSFCHHNRGLLPKLLLGQACAERRREARKAVA